MPAKNEKARNRHEPAARIPVGILIHARHYRESLALSLREVPEWNVVDLGDGSVDSVERLLHLHPRVALLDLHPPELRVLVREVRQALPEIALVALNQKTDAALALSLFEVGLTSFVESAAGIDDVKAAIRGALHGELHRPQPIVAALVRRVNELGSRTSASGADSVLSSRELDVVRLIDQGYTNKEIAARLCIEPATVKNHVHHILEKLSVRDRREAAAKLRRG